MSDSRPPGKPDRPEQRPATPQRRSELPPPPRITREQLSLDDIDDLGHRRRLPVTAEREARPKAAYVPAPAAEAPPAESAPVPRQPEQRRPPAAVQPAAPAVAAKSAVPPKKAPPGLEGLPRRERPEPPEDLPPPPVTRTRLQLEHARVIDREASWVDELPYPLQQIHNNPILLIPICVLLAAIIWVTLPANDQQYLSGYVNRAVAAIVPPNPKQADLTQFASPAPNGEHSLLGAPSISAATIDRVLAAYGSPAAGTGQIWIDLGLQYGLDPAYALAFFIHESGAGTAPGWAGHKSEGGTTHNIGNIICAGYDTCYGRFRDYPNWRTGIEDWYRLIAVEYVQWRGVHTVEQIIPIYAPAFENDVSGYVNVVEGLVNEWRAEEQR